MRVKSVIAMVMTAALVVSTVSFGVYKSNHKEPVVKDVKAANNNAATNNKLNLSGDAIYTKDENVYGVLNLDGSVSEIYVVNQFEVEKEGVIKDLGNYENVTNLTNPEEIVTDGNEHSFVADKGYFYYQGEVGNKEMPWTFDVKYYLDDEEILGDELAGKSGRFRTEIKVKNSTKEYSDFYDNYLLQISMTLDNEKASNINAYDGQIADAGISKQINYTVLPGKEGTFKLEADVIDFSMAGISIAAVPYSMNVELPDTDSMAEGLTKLSDGVSKLDEGAGKLDDGVSELADGVEKYVGGIKKFNTGLSTVNENYSKLSEGGTKIVKGSSGINSGLAQLSKNKESIDSGSDSINKALSGLKSRISDMDLSSLSDEDRAILVGTINSLADNYGEFNSGIKAYTKGAENIADGYNKFDSGLSDYVSGVKKMGEGIDKLSDGSKKLADNGGKLCDGLKELSSGLSDYKEGTGEFADKVSDMPDEMDKQIDEMMSDYVKDFDAVSFANDKNSNINAVQFIIKTKDINKKEVKKEAYKEEKLSFVERVAKLFK